MYFSKPFDSNIRLEKEEASLTIDIPPGSPGDSAISPLMRTIIPLILTFTSGITIFIAFYFSGIEFDQNLLPFIIAGGGMLIVIDYFIVYILMGKLLSGFQMRMVFNSEELIFTGGDNTREYGRKIVKIADIRKVHKLRIPLSWRSPKYTCVIETKQNRSYSFGAYRSEQEIDWLVYEINNYLAHLPYQSNFYQT